MSEVAQVPDGGRELSAMTPEDLLKLRMAQIDQLEAASLADIDAAEEDLAGKVGADVSRGVTEAMRTTAKEAAQQQRVEAKITYDNALIIADIEDDLMRESALGR